MPAVRGSDSRERSASRPASLPTARTEKELESHAAAPCGCQEEIIYEPRSCRARPSAPSFGLFALLALQFCGAFFFGGSSLDFCFSGGCKARPTTAKAASRKFGLVHLNHPPPLCPSPASQSSITADQTAKENNSILASQGRKGRPPTDVLPTTLPL